jgi:hypothetical protein
VLDVPEKQLAFAARRRGQGNNPNTRADSSVSVMVSLYRRVAAFKGTMTRIFLNPLQMMSLT